MLFSNIISKSITERDLEYWEKVTRILLAVGDNVRKVPDKKCPRYVCHSICHALKYVIPEVRLAHGCYLGLDITQESAEVQFTVRNCRHSWLVTPDNAIIDPYPVGMLAANPIMIGTSEFDCFGRTFYHEQPSVVVELDYRKIWRQARILLRLMH